MPTLVLVVALPAPSHDIHDAQDEGGTSARSNIICLCAPCHFKEHGIREL
ncbi:MAG: hypothetical protein D4R38_03075 [Dehalococcoidia bacterium]|nr:MAG: hypothetical protein D4R38_03075 [Dehalococcoidia bacterium]